jgi:hypothetical protein
LTQATQTQRQDRLFPLASRTICLVSAGDTGKGRSPETVSRMLHPDWAAQQVSNQPRPLPAPSCFKLPTLPSLYPPTHQPASLKVASEDSILTGPGPTQAASLFPWQLKGWVRSNTQSKQNELHMGGPGAVTSASRSL